MKITPVKLWRRQKQTGSLIGTKGKIVLWSIIRIPAKAFGPQAPYPIVIVELANKERMIGQLVDWTNDDLVFGREVVAVLRRTRIEEKDDVISYNIKFRPV